MELTSANVRDSIVASVYDDSISDEEQSLIKVHCVLERFTFDLDAINRQRKNIEAMLMQLPVDFRLSKTDPIYQMIFVEEFFNLINSPNIDLKLMMKIQPCFPGQSFLDACVTNDGVRWGEKANVEELLSLGMAIGKVKIVFPRPFWKYLRGSVPNFVILNSDDPDQIQLLQTIDNMVKETLNNRNMSDLSVELAV